MSPKVLTAALDFWADPEEMFSSLCGESHKAFWLDCGPQASTGVSYLGVAASLTTDFDGPVLDWLREQAFDANVDAVESAFALGWVGWLGYEIRAETLGTPVQRVSRYPDAAWMFVDRCLAFNHETRVITALALEDIDSYVQAVTAAWLQSKGRGRLSGAVPRPVPGSQQLPVTWAYTDDEYLDMVEACQKSIRNGDAYQLCLTTEATVEAYPDPFDTYVALRNASPTHHGAFLLAGDVAVLSSSPERFLSVSRQGLLETKPIKGTRPRGNTDLLDMQLRTELESSDKERAENLMIVDLMRNDISRVCELGSVAVTNLLQVESYAQVHQLVSTIQGHLAQGMSGIDAIEVCFPAGSMTGAPKFSATQILDDLEQRPRGIYSGALGYISLDGAVDLAVVIRSIILDSAGATVGAGGGITALSVPLDELAEAKLKAAVLLSVLGADSPTSIVRGANPEVCAGNRKGPGQEVR